MNDTQKYDVLTDCPSNAFSFFLYSLHKGKSLSDVCESRHITTIDVRDDMSIDNFFDIQYIDIKSRLYVVATHLGIPYLDDVSKYNFSEKVIGNVEAISFFEKNQSIVVSSEGRDWLLVGTPDLLKVDYEVSNHFALQSIIEEYQLDGLPRIAANPDQIKVIIDRLKKASSQQSRTINVTKVPCDTYNLIAQALKENVSTIHIKYDENSHFNKISFLEHELSMVDKDVELANSNRLYSTLNSMNMSSKSSISFYTKVNNLYHEELPKNFACHCSKIYDSNQQTIFILQLYLEVSDKIKEVKFDRVLNTSNTNLRKQLVERMKKYKSSIICVPPNHCLTLIEQEIHCAVLANINDKGDHFIINTDNYNYSGSKQTPISISEATDESLFELSSSFINLGKITRASMPMSRVESLINNYQRVIAVTQAPKEQLPTILKSYVIEME